MPLHVQFTAWMPGEPNNLFGQENRLELSGLYYKGKFGMNDANGTHNNKGSVFLSYFYLQQLKCSNLNSADAFFPDPTRIGYVDIEFSKMSLTLLTCTDRFSLQSTRI